MERLQHRYRAKGTGLAVSAVEGRDMDLYSPWLADAARPGAPFLNGPLLANSVTCAMSCRLPSISTNMSTLGSPLSVGGQADLPSRIVRTHAVLNPTGGTPL